VRASLTVNSSRPRKIGYKIAGVAGAGIAAAATYLPSFIFMLTILPVFERVRTLGWITAAMQGVGPAVSGLLAVSILRVAPHALPDPFAVAMLVGTLIASLAWRLGAIKLMLAGAGLGVLRSRLCAQPGVKGSCGTSASTPGANQGMEPTR
jgi:chromate transporter